MSEPGGAVLQGLTRKKVTAAMVSLACVVLATLPVGEQAEAAVVEPSVEVQIIPVVARGPWIPVGATGVVRGGLRNAAVVAERDVEVAFVSADTYLRHWFRPAPISDLPAIVDAWRAVGTAADR